MPHDCMLLKTSVCSHCPALVANRHRIVHGYGDPQARVMIVGEAPGYLGADRTGVPFTGDRSDRRVQALLIRLGLSKESNPAAELPRLHGVFLTNVVRCNPPGNRNPTPAEVGNCTSYLQMELDSIRPKVVATLGTFRGSVGIQSAAAASPPGRHSHAAWPGVADRRCDVVVPGAPGTL